MAELLPFCGLCSRVVYEDTRNWKTVLPAGRLLILRSTHDLGFSLRIGETLYLTFRGTDDLSDWESNLRSRLHLREEYGGMVHQGMAESLDELLRGDPLEEELRGCRNLVATGHSRGGWMAIAAAFRYAGKVSRSVAVTFGSPRYGNPEAVRRVERAVHVLRIVHAFDLVPLTPWKGWAHPGDCLTFQVQGDRFLWKDTLPLAPLLHLLMFIICRRWTFLCGADSLDVCRDHSMRLYEQAVHHVPTQRVPVRL